MRASQVVEALSLYRSDLFSYTIVRNSLNDNSKESHQRVRYGRDS